MIDIECPPATVDIKQLQLWYKQKLIDKAHYIRLGIIHSLSSEENKQTLDLEATRYKLMAEGIKVNIGEIQTALRLLEKIGLCKSHSTKAISLDFDRWYTSSEERLIWHRFYFRHYWTPIVWATPRHYQVTG